MKSNVILLVLCCLCSNLISQEHDQLLSVINSNLEATEKQRKIDSIIILIQDKVSLTTLADCYHDLGSKWYYPNSTLSPGDSSLENAIFYTMESLKIKRTLSKVEDCSINKTIYNLGYFNFRNSNIYDAIELYKELEQYGYQYCTDRENNKDKVKWALQELASINKILGNYYTSLDVCDRMLSIFEADEHPVHIGQLIATEAHLQKAEIYFQIDPFKYENQIYDHLNHAESLNKITNTEYHNNQARILNLRANCRSETADYLGALKTYPIVLDYFTESDSLNKAIVYSNMGYCLNKLERFNEAEDLLRKAIEQNPVDGNPYNNLGDLFLAKQKFKMAMEHYNEAIALSTDENWAIDYSKLPPLPLLELSTQKILILNHLVTKANAWISWYEHQPDTEYLEHALATFDLADQLVDFIRYESSEQQSKLYWREKGASLYLKAVEVCHLLDRPERAFYFMERNKALLLLEDLGHEEAKRIAGLPVEAAQQEFKLRQQIFLAENDFSEADSNADMEHLKSAVRESKTNYEDFIDSLNTAYPDYARYKRKIDILTFDDLKARYLLPDKFVIHFILNEEDGYGLLNTPDSSQFFRLEDVEQLNQDIGRYILLLSSGISDIEAFKELSHNLYLQLIPGKIRGKLQGKQLLIVPDYSLQRIPFETLVTDISGPKYLIEEAEVSYAYSLSLLERQSMAIRHIENDIITMAPVSFGTDDLHPLQYSEEEAIAVNNLFTGDLFLEARASKSNFMEVANGHKIIHLATHADLGDGENPWIAFSDGKMYLNEIYATPTNSDMVVLSACNTSQGNLKPGEGIMSLARGFFYSGANSVVSSLWPITDKGGSDIMQSFYKNLKRGATKSAALREAKLDYLENARAEELKHPFYWAGFVILGDNSPLNQPSHWYWILLLIVLVIPTLYLLIKRSIKRSH